MDSKIIEYLKKVNVAAYCNDFAITFALENPGVIHGFCEEKRKKRKDVEEKAPLECAACGKPQGKKKLKMCSRCRCTFYCNKVCSKNHWKIDKKVCRQLKKV